MIEKNELLDIRRRLKRIDDGSKDYKDVYNHYSWFLARFIDFDKKRKKKNEKREMTTLVNDE